MLQRACMFLEVHPLHFWNGKFQTLLWLSLFFFDKTSLHTNLSFAAWLWNPEQIFGTILDVLTQSHCQLNKLKIAGSDETPIETHSKPLKTWQISKHLYFILKQNIFNFYLLQYFCFFSKLIVVTFFTYGVCVTCFQACVTFFSAGVPFSQKTQKWPCCLSLERQFVR